MIEAYCTLRSYAAGDRIDIHVSTDAESYSISVGREAKTRRVVHEAHQLEGHLHPVPTDVVARGCGWPVGLSFFVSAAWKSGFYRIILTASDGQTGEAFFILRAIKPAASILWTIETNTWNAYNYYGGASTYTRDLKTYSNGAAYVSFQRPLPKGFLSLPDSHPRLANPGKPDTSVPYGAWAEEHDMLFWSGAASWGLWGTAFASWLEDEGIEVDYAASSDLEENPDMVSPYALLLAAGHDEYWSWAMRDTVENFVADGGNAVFLTGNTAFWQVRFEQGGQVMVAFKSAVESDPVLAFGDPRRNTGIWSHHLTGRPENLMTGLSFTRGGYARIAGATPASAGGFTIYRHGHWALRDTGLSYGDQLGFEYALVGYETDGCALTLRNGLPYPTGEDGTPIDFEIIGIAPAALFDRETAPAGMYPEDVLTDLELVVLQVTGSPDPVLQERFSHGHAVFGTFRKPGGGTVFSAGTTEWVSALGDAQVAAITRNVLARLSRRSHE